MKVKNVNGLGHTTCACGSWLNHWIKCGGERIPRYCMEAKCTQAPEVGAHVQKDDPSDNGWYVVPLCKAHNAEKERSLTISDAAQLVSANVGGTCGKK